MSGRHDFMNLMEIERYKANADVGYDVPSFPVFKVNKLKN